MSCTRKKDQLGLTELNPILSGSPRLVTHLNGHRHTQIHPNAANVCRHRCWWEHVHTHFQQREWPHAAQCNPAAAARCIPHYIPDFPSDIPAQCGGNLQCGGFTGLKKGEKVKGQSSNKVRMNKRGQSSVKSHIKQLCTFLNWTIPTSEAGQDCLLFEN